MPLVKTPTCTSFPVVSAGSKISLRSFQLAENKEKVTENMDGDNSCSFWHRLLRGINFLGPTDSRESKTERKVQSHQSKTPSLFSHGETAQWDQMIFPRWFSFWCVAGIKTQESWLLGHWPSPCYKATEPSLRRMISPYMCYDLFLHPVTFQESSFLLFFR